MLKICFSIVPLYDVSEQVSKVDGDGMKLLYFFRIINFLLHLFMETTVKSFKNNQNNDVIRYHKIIKILFSDISEFIITIL